MARRFPTRPTAARPPMVGTINARSSSPAVIKERYGDRPFRFDGTTRGLTVAALDTGARAGDEVWADYGLGFRRYRMVKAPGDMRAGQHWMEAIR